MNKKLYQKIVLYGIVAIMSIYIGMYLAPKTTPSLSALPKISGSEAEEVARQYLRSINENPEDYHEYSYFRIDETGSDYVVSKLGFEKYRDIMSNEELPLASWTIEYLLNVPRNNNEKRFVIQVGLSGKLESFQYFIPDSVAGDDIDSLGAINLTKEYIAGWPGKKLDGFELERTNTFKKPKRMDTNLIYSKSFPGLDEGGEKLNIYIAGNKIISVHHYFEEPSEANAETVGGWNIIFVTISIITYFFVTILGIVLFLKLYHDGQIGVKNSLIMGGLLYLTLILGIINLWDIFSIGTGMGSISRIYTRWILFGVQLVISYVYMFVNTFSSWAVSDYYLRTEKPSLLSGIDSVLSGKIITKNVGREVPMGFVYGTILFGLIQCINFLLIEFTSARPRVDNHIISGESPFFGLLLLAMTMVLFDEIVFRKFFTTYLKIKFKSLPVAVLVSGFAYALFNIFFGEYYDFWPGFYTLIPYFVLGAIQAWVFWNYGILAAMSSAFFYISFVNLTYVFNVAHPSYTMQGIIFVGLLAAVLLTGLIGLLKGKTFEYSSSSEPEHIRRIKERARMQQELEIARKVQLGLLPKEKPQLQGFDISGICLPALEVGGDYFDFIDLKDGRLGLAIADVSGKGVPAAIYMTLTKGILQSHAEATLSPKIVLSKVNSLMYRTIEKSWYVSMFYAVLDPKSKQLIFSRAGHNPAIVLNRDKSSPQLLQPAGIGLGLEMGEIFSKTLVEGELQLEPGNTLVFYTDGFTEAMNVSGQEYGEDRFLKFLSENDNGSANDLVNLAIKEIQSFAGEAPQHDDMTMVVLKVY
jgi:Stage II sporulation protein E (SpoIIE)/Type II CAAX prenyl endopeptidase Rce1-like